MEAGHPTGEKSNANPIDRDLLRCRFIALHHKMNRDGAENANWDVDKENPWPAVIVRKPSPQDRPHNRCHNDDSAPKGKGCILSFRRKHEDNQCLRKRNHRTREEPLKKTSHNENSDIPRDATHPREESKAKDGNNHEANNADPFGKPTTKRQDNGATNGK